MLQTMGSEVLDSTLPLRARLARTLGGGEAGLRPYLGGLVDSLDRVSLQSLLSSCGQENGMLGNSLLEYPSSLPAQGTGCD